METFSKKMKDMIFFGVFMICNLTLAYNEEGIMRLLNLVAYIVLLIYFIYLYYKKEDNEKN